MRLASVAKACRQLCGGGRDLLHADSGKDIVELLPVFLDPERGASVLIVKYRAGRSAADQILHDLEDLRRYRREQ